MKAKDMYRKSYVRKTMCHVLKSCKYMQVTYEEISEVYVNAESEKCAKTRFKRDEIRFIILLGVL